jgi:cobalamin biosynthesis protein CbiG
VPELAVVALTPRGLELGHRLVRALGAGEVVSAGDSTRQTLQELFTAGRPMVAIMALGIVVRVLGPLAHDKAGDPAVVVVDEAGQFAISVLGGHAAGANLLARQVAQAVGSIPVITTASDVLGLPALDLVGRDWGWKIERREDLTRVMAAAVRGEAIAVYQDAGRRDWWKPFGDWPESFHHVPGIPESPWAGVLLITDRALLSLPPEPVVVYRPPTLVLGVGCRRGVPWEEIEELFQRLCVTQGFAPLSLGLVATADIKKDEPGLREFASRHEVPVRAFSLEELAAVAELPTPSEAVRARIGIPGVAEPAALLGAGTKWLLVPKCRGRRVTMALARRDDA